MALAHLLRRLDALVLEAGRHADVGHHHLGVRGRGPLDELVVVGGDAHHVEVGLEPEQGPHALPHQEVVVSEEHGDPPFIAHGHIRPGQSVYDKEGSSRIGGGASTIDAHRVPPSAAATVVRTVRRHGPTDRTAGEGKITVGTASTVTAPAAAGAGHRHGDTRRSVGG